jgi:hypothetical protein
MCGIYVEAVGLQADSALASLGQKSADLGAQFLRDCQGGLDLSEARRSAEVQLALLPEVVSIYR